MNTLLEPFHYGFFRHALMVAVLAGALCGLVGVYVVLRGMSYIGHGLSHAIFGGSGGRARRSLAAPPARRSGSSSTSARRRSGSGRRS